MWSWITGADTADTEDTPDTIDTEETPEQDYGISDTVTDEEGVARNTVNNTLIIEGASVRDCFDVVSSIEKYTDFLAAYENIEVLTDEFDEETKVRTRTARYTLSIPSVLYVIVDEISYILKIASHYDEATNTARMSWKGIDGPSFIVENDGQWDVSEKDGASHLGLQLAVGYSFYVPGYIKSWIETNMLTETLNNFKQRIRDVSKIE
ncbi:mannose-6-phosphate isomerase [Acrasis kona]|uniref:Mannose-6-phosphate isomerase n=1 Tax=Acrasis kona TaxID=1008807 RepID=A0AAW2ZGB0_9EUKA